MQGGQDLVTGWQSVFWRTIRQREHAEPLKEASVRSQLGAWTHELTNVVVAPCESLGWEASAKWHKLDLLPVTRSEYLTMDVAAFASTGARWRFPVAVMELENSQDDKIAYSLWKVLCVRAALREVFCYRSRSDQGPALVRFLRDEVVRAMGLKELTDLEGQVLVVVGSRAESATFPYEFFKWWRLEHNTGAFELL